MGNPHSTGQESMLTTYCHELASMARTLHGLLEHTVRRGLPLGHDTKAMIDLVPPLEALRDLLHEALGGAAAAPAPPADPIEQLPVDPLHHLGLERQMLRGVSMSLDDVFTDGGFQDQGPRPFHRLVVEDLRNTFGVPKMLGQPESPTARQKLNLHDGSPTARRDDRRQPTEPAKQRPRSLESLLSDLRRNYDSANVTMEGTTESLPIQTVFESLSASRKTGTLHLRTDDETLVFELENGDVVFAASDSTPAGDRLGDILIERGWIDPEQLRTALDAQLDSRQRLGSALEREELVSRDQLREALEEQIHRHFLRAFQTRRAAYAFAKGNRDDIDQRVRLNVSRLLFESARVSDESARDRSLEAS